MGRGFTLIETIMVIVIASILGIALFMRWGPSDAARLEAAARKISGDIRYAQKLSISTYEMAGVLFDANGYSVYAIVNSAALANSPGGPCSKDASGKFVVDFREDRCSDFSGVTITPPLANPLAFDTIGRPINNATGAALSTQTVGVNYKGAKNISIEAVTGRVSY
ncbi:MAG: prepilin-type N-terminal cleavage/methylation domain-containing protein [Thermodesulfovibrionales bacterium]|nr:prepilin-type N-terminal cleavage/methylation domain-containing protein [Thermodesulfovibrionales bacterium]